jgi:hypothetical protein
VHLQPLTPHWRQQARHHSVQRTCADSQPHQHCCGSAIDCKLALTKQLAGSRGQSLYTSPPWQYAACLAGIERDSHADNPWCMQVRATHVPHSAVCGALARINMQTL